MWGRGAAGLTWIGQVLARLGGLRQGRGLAHRAERTAARVSFAFLQRWGGGGARRRRSVGIFLPERGRDGLVRAEVRRLGAADVVVVVGGRDGLRLAGAAGALPPAAGIAAVQPGRGRALEGHGVEVQAGDAHGRRAEIQIVLRDAGSGVEAIGGAVAPLDEGVGLVLLLPPAFLSFLSRGG